MRGAHNDQPEVVHGCKDATTPKSNGEFWQKKFERNVANDKKHTRQLRKLGWHVITVWECQLKKPEKVLQRLETLLTARERTDRKNEPPM